MSPSHRVVAVVRAGVALMFMATLAVGVALALDPQPGTAASKPLPGQTLDYSDFLRQLTDLDSLMYFTPGVRCAQFSSYDRASRYDEATGTYVNWGANADYGQYIRIDEATGEGVMAEIEGPGCIYRIWSAGPAGKIRFYLDGDTKPTYEFDFLELFIGEIEPFRRPVVWQRRIAFPGENNPASDSYLPIPFAKSCKVTAITTDADGKTHAPSYHYHIGYKTFPKNWTVATFRLPLTKQESALLDEVCAKWNQCGEDPNPLSETETVTKNLTLPPGETVIADIPGRNQPHYSAIAQLRAKLDSDEPFATRKILLRAYWDDEETPSIDCPIGDFFCRAVGDEPYASLPMGMTDKFDYCYFRMPFKSRARLVAVNEGSEPAKLHCEIVLAPITPSPLPVAYFHAKWRTEPQSATFDYPFLECTGRGQFVGVFMCVDNFAGGWWGEGDEKVWVDGEKFPSTFGTGSEDYFGDAWGIRFFANPYHGCLHNAGRKQACYRWHISDSIPFEQSFRMTIENYSALGEVKNGYASVAYWYQVEPHHDFFTPTPVMQRIPSPAKVVAGALEAESLFDPEHLPRGVAILADPSMRDTLSWGRGVSFTGPPGTRFPLALTVENEDLYTIELYGPDGEPAHRFSLYYDDKPVGEKLHLTRGTHDFELQLGQPQEAVGQTGATLDYLMVRPHRSFIKEWMVIGSFPNPQPGCQGFDKAYPPEQGIDFSGQYTGVGDAKVTWKKVTAGPNGYIDLRAACAPPDNVVAYAAVTVTSPDERKTDFLIGSDDGVKVWLNGALVHTNHTHRGAAPDQDRVAVTLGRGENTLLIKLDQGGGAWGFLARFLDPDESLRYSVPQ